MISEEDQRRIRQDAALAHDALESLMCESTYLTEEYVMEKIELVKRCARFISKFEGGTT